MASDALFQELAKALGRPSRAFRAAQAGLAIPEEGLKGYEAGSELADKFQTRKLENQTLSQALGGNVPDSIKGYGGLTVKQFKPTGEILTGIAALDKALREQKEKPQKYQMAPFLKNGHLVRFNPITGQYEIADDPGDRATTVPGGNAASGTPGNVITGTPELSPRVAPTIPASETDKLSDLMNMKEALGVARKNFSPDFVGPGSARLQGVRQTVDMPSLGLGASKQGALFTQSVQDLKDRLLRARSGAQINEQEYQRLSTLVPDQYKSVPDFLAKMDRFQEVLDQTISSKRQELMRAGYRGASSLPAPQPTDSSPTSIGDPEADAAIARINASNIDPAQKQARIKAVMARAGR